MTKRELINKIKSLVTSRLLSNKNIGVDFRLMYDIYDTIEEADIAPYRENKLVAHNDRYGYIYENSSIRLSNGCLLFFYSIFDNFVTMRYSGYYPFVIDLDRVNEKIEQIDRINNN